jgi:hypothetical protein
LPIAPIISGQACADSACLAAAALT